MSDLFEIRTPSCKYNANMVALVDASVDGAHPYVVRTAENNGRRAYIVGDEQYLCPGYTFSFGQDTATVFWQGESYYTGDKIKMLVPLHDVDDEVAMFYLVSVRRAFGLFAWGQSRFCEAVLRDVEVVLPVIAGTREPDFDFMRRYIKAQQKLVVANVVRAYQDELDTYNKVVA